jgi:Domain of unknown function (DUF4375)
MGVSRREAFVGNRPTPDGDGSQQNAWKRPFAARMRYIYRMQYPEAFDELLFDSKKEFDAVAPEVQAAYCIHRLEAEVNNGGFHQFFLNSSGEYVRETLQALAAIGAVATHALLERAVAIGFPEGYPADAQQHQESLADFDDVADALNLLDLAFFEYPEPLEELVNDYLAAKH